MIAMTEFSSGVGKHISKCNNAHFWTRVKSQEKLREFELEIRSKLFYFCFRVWFKFRIFTRIYISALTGFGFLSSIFYFVSPYLCYDTRKNLANRCVLTTCNVKAHSEFISSDSTAFITASHHWFYNSSNFPSISSFPPWLFSFLPQSPLWPHLERKKNNIAATCQMTWPTNFMEWVLGVLHSLDRRKNLQRFYEIELLAHASQSQWSFNTSFLKLPTRFLKINGKHFQNHCKRIFVPVKWVEILSL